MAFTSPRDRALLDVCRARSPPVAQMASNVLMHSSGRMGYVAAGAVLLLVAVDLVMTAVSPGAQVSYGVGVRYALYAVAAFAAGAAAATFGWWREPIGRPWTLFFIEFALLLVNYAMRRTAPDARLAQDVTLVVANLAQIGAYFLVSRMLHDAGLASIVSPARRVVLTIAALIVAVAISQASLVAQWQMIRAGQASTSSLIALLTDVITFTLIAPLAISTFALRGGQVFWIFAFLTLSVFGWMFNELGAEIAAHLGGSESILRTTRMAGIAVAALFNAAAATTLWASARRAMRGIEAHA